MALDHIRLLAALLHGNRSIPMLLKESDILYENGDYWVCKSFAKKGYEVYRIGITNSTRCAIIGFEGEEGLKRAKAECDKRAASKKF